MSKKFIDQIKEDLQSIKNSWLNNNPKLEKDWYAFNYWILNYLYHIDIEDISNFITEYNDKGIDCFVHFEDAKELYLIQNCFYSDSSNLKREHIADFLVSPLNSLCNYTYTRSKLLQDIFNILKDDKEYTVYLYCYTTKLRNNISKDILSLFDKDDFNYNFNVETKLIDIEDLKYIYEGKRFDKFVSFECTIKIKNDDIIIHRSEQHDKGNNVDTAYVAINVYEIYNMLRQSYDKDYDLFDKNIREYLGIKGKKGRTNKEIRATLLDDTERNRFFYYNNGITIICESFKKYQNKRQVLLDLIQPQIVNGCQTVNTIYNTIDELTESKASGEIAKSFKNCSILVKIFKVNKSNDSERAIYENIVRYTNTQTSITAKDFASKDDYFINLQDDFAKYGFYLIVKQSDNAKYESDADFEKMKERSSERIKMFSKTVNKPKDLYIDLDKLLKCLMAFYFDGYIAYKKGAYALKENSDLYYTNFSKKIRDYFSSNNMINLFLLFEESGGMTTGKKDSRYPVPYYLMDFIGRYIKLSPSNEYDAEKVNNKLNYLFSSKEVFDEVYTKFCEINADYCDDFIENYNTDYNTMIKGRKIDSALLMHYFKQTKKYAVRNNWSYFLKFIE